MKNTVKGMNSRVGDTEEHTNDLEVRIMEITQTEQQKRRANLKNDNSLKDIWDNRKWTNICIIGLLEGKRERRESKMYIMK